MWISDRGFWHRKVVELSHRLEIELTTSTTMAKGASKSDCHHCPGRKMPGNCRPAYYMGTRYCKKHQTVCKLCNNGFAKVHMKTELCPDCKQEEEESD
jgi:hypothetical protein